MNRLLKLPACVYHHFVPHQKTRNYRHGCSGVNRWALDEFQVVVGIQFMLYNDPNSLQ